MPNITGIVSPDGLLWGKPSGAFYTDGGRNAPYKDPEGGNNIKFDASKSNQIFGKSTTIQPSSLRSTIIVRT